MADSIDDELLSNLDKPAGTRSKARRSAKRSGCKARRSAKRSGCEAPPRPAARSAAVPSAAGAAGETPAPAAEVWPRPVDSDAPPPGGIDPDFVSAPTRSAPLLTPGSAADAPPRKLELTLNADRAPAPEAGVPLATLIARESAGEPEPGPGQGRRIATLEDQVTMLRAQVTQTRQQASRHRFDGRMLGAASALALLLGAAGGFLAGSGPTTPAQFVVVPTSPAKAADPVFRFKPSNPVQTTPTRDDIEGARHMLVKAEEQLAARDVEGAQASLGVCIQVADLPECHKRLGTLLALMHDPAAQTHFERYLQVAPDAADAAELRRALGKTNRE